ncbi:LysR family transcriptional regulator [Xanthomonas sp. AmX2]|uniref:LysR family transcriptional regulator n=1 Tax=Xanthomonas sp. TaxID=29446 RepID=UPI00197F74B8|nr:LysR family transcriptional regulator [Xanthomonas sp.]MBN6151875.1 LysR family transcriptional regulator [Xanthomonas sp.]
MDLRQLEAFAAVMSVGSITGAGQMLGRSQPAVTRLIRDLEDELGFLLFERNGPKVTPTDKAFLLQAEVEGTLAGVRQIRQRAERICQDETLEVRLVATPALAAGLVPAALARLPAETRPQHVQLRSLPAEQVVHAVLSRTMDLGVVSLPLEHRGVDVHWIGEAPCVAVLPAGSPLAAAPRLTLEALAGQTLITLANPFRLRRRIDKVLAGAPQPLHVLETNASLNATQMARAGLGIALVDPVSALGIPQDGVVVRPLEVDIPFFFGTITPYAHPLSASTRALIGSLEDTARALLPGFVRHELGAHDALLQRIHGDA